MKYASFADHGRWTIDHVLWSMVSGLSSLVDDVIFAFHCNGIILSEKCAQFGEVACGVFAGDPGFVYGGDFDDEARFGFLQLSHEVCAQELEVGIGYVVVEIEIKYI